MVFKNFLIFIIKIVYLQQNINWNNFILDSKICFSLNKYLDKNLMKCRDCPSNMIPSNEGKTCICNSSSSYQDNPFRSIKKNCLNCNNSGPSYDKLRCISCSTCNCNDTQIKDDKFDNGSYRNNYNCINCTNGFYSYKNKCIPLIEGESSRTNNSLTCSNGYISTGNRCVRSVTNYPLELARQITYQSYIDNTQSQSFTNTNSALINFFYQGVAASCNEKNITNDCQMFGNICTLLYFSLSNEVCKKFKSLVDSKPLVNNSIEFIN